MFNGVCGVVGVGESSCLSRLLRCLIFELIRLISLCLLGLCWVLCCVSNWVVFFRLVSGLCSLCVRFLRVVLSVLGSVWVGFSLGNLLIGWVFSSYLFVFYWLS